MARTRRPSPKLHKLMANHYRPFDRMAQPPREPPPTEILTLEQLLDALGTPSKKNAGEVAKRPAPAKR